MVDFRWIGGGQKKKKKPTIQLLIYLYVFMYNTNFLSIPMIQPARGHHSFSITYFCFIEIKFILKYNLAYYQRHRFASSRLWICVLLW